MIEKIAPFCDYWVTCPDEEFEAIIKEIRDNPRVEEAAGQHGFDLEELLRDLEIARANYKRTPPQ